MRKITSILGRRTMNTRLYFVVDFTNARLHGDTQISPMARACQSPIAQNLQRRSMQNQMGKTLTKSSRPWFKRLTLHISFLPQLSIACSRNDLWRGLNTILKYFWLKALLSGSKGNWNERQLFKQFLGNLKNDLWTRRQYSRISWKNIVRNIPESKSNAYCNRWTQKTSRVLPQQVGTTTRHSIQMMTNNCLNASDGGHTWES